MSDTEIVQVNVHPDGDGMKALYWNGYAIASGDEYHENIQARLEGVMQGMAIMGWDRNYKEYNIEGDASDPYMDDGCMPDALAEFDLTNIKAKKRKYHG